MQTAGLELDAYLQVCCKIFLIINIRNMTLSLLINSMFIFLERKSKISLFFLYPWTDSSLFLSRVLQFLLYHLKFHHYSLSISTMGSTEARTGRLNLIQGRPETNASPLPGSLGCLLPQHRWKARLGRASHAMAGCALHSKSTLSWYLFLCFNSKSWDLLGTGHRKMFAGLFFLGMLGNSDLGPQYCILQCAVYKSQVWCV